MGPLVPEFISEEFNYIIALIVGMGFGFALEQGGFASTKKLVGLFYGYDFTVLRVFFTAGVTAMVGVVLLNHLGMLDVSIIFINPTFLWSALVGGVIMGAGFIVGGFCPGTSACAAAVGRLDGVAFLFGSLLGIFAFAETFPMLETLYLAREQGPVLMFEKLGMTRELFALVMVLVAVGAFVATQLIENKINNRPTLWQPAVIRKNALITAIPVLIVFFVMVTPTRREVMNSRIDAKIMAGECNPKLIEADKLAYELMNQYYLYNVVDVRTPDEYKAFHIPTAINIPLEQLADHENLQLITQNVKTNIFYGADEMQAKRACMVARYFGKADNMALRETAGMFQQQFFNLGNPTANMTKAELNVYNFRREAAHKLKEIGEAVANLDQPVKKKPRKIKGGCS